MRTMLTVLVVLLSGCSPQPRIWKFGAIKPFSLYYAEQAQVKEACGPLCRPGVPAFFNHAKRELWLSWNAWDRIPHELCHAEGNHEEVCRKKAP